MIFFFSQNFNEYFSLRVDRICSILLLRSLASTLLGLLGFPSSAFFGYNVLSTQKQNEILGSFFLVASPDLIA